MGDEELTDDEWDAAMGEFLEILDERKAAAGIGEFSRDTVSGGHTGRLWRDGAGDRLNKAGIPKTRLDEILKRPGYRPDPRSYLSTEYTYNNLFVRCAMSKKVLLISGFILAAIFLGDILFMFTHNSLLANWGAIIIPSFIMGVLWKLLIKDNLKNAFKYVIPLILGLTKLTLFLMTVQEPTLLAAIFIPIIYSAVSYISLILGLRAVPDKDMSKAK